MKYFQIFLSFSVASRPQKHNETRLLSPQTEYLQVDLRLTELLRTPIQK